MSAYIVTNATINAVLHYYRSSRDGGSVLRLYERGGGREIGPWHNYATWKKMGQIIYAQNVRSVNFRYNDNVPETDYCYAFPLIPPLSPLEIIRLCDCIDYQSCETPDWHDTEACWFVQQIKNHACRKLPGYDDAPNDIGSNHLFARACK